MNVKGIQYKRIALITIVIIIILGLIIGFVPTLIARHLIESEFEKLGIKHSGINTVRINLFKREFWAGPLNVRMSESDPGQLGELGIKISVFPMFKKRAMVDSVLIRGIDIVVSRNLDNIITLNGIPLNQFFPKDEDDEDDEKVEQWGIGLLKLDLLDSRLIFREKSGGILTVEIDKFSLRNFHSWYPDEAGIFDLKAQVNDIKLNWTGQARPFANNITFTIDTQSNEATLPKIIRFVGPLGFKRKDGVYNSRMHHNFTIFDSGRLEGTTNGTLEVIGLYYEREGEFSVMLDRSDIDLNTEYSLSESSDFELRGRVNTKTANLKGEAAKENSFGVDSAVIELEDLNLTLGADKAFQVSSKIQSTIENFEYSGTIQLSIGTLLDVLKYIQSLSTRKNAALEQKQLGYKSDSKISTPRSDIKVKKIISNSLFDLKSAGGDVSIETAGSIEGSEINYVVSERTTTIESLRSELKSLNIRTSEDEVSINLIGNTYANGYQIKGPIGHVRVEKVETVIKDCGVKIQPGETAVEVSISALLNGAKFSTKERKDITQTNISASEIMATNKGSIVVSEQEMGWQTDVSFKVNGLDVSLDKGTMANVKLSILELKGAQANQNQEFKIESLSVSGLDIFITRQFVEKVLKIRSDKSKNQDKYASQNDKELHSSTIKEIQKRLKEKGHYKGSIDGQMGPQTEAAINAFREVSGLPLAGVGLKKLLSALTDTSGPPIALSFGHFALVDGAKIRFEDTTIEPAVDIETFFHIAEIQGFDTSDPAKRAKVRIEADINEFTQLELDGWVAGFGHESNVDINGKIENIELHTYSPYTAEFAGFMLDSGQLTLLTNGISKEGNLDGLLNVELEGLEFTPLSAEDLERVNGRTGLPIETLIGFLENSEGRIDLELPIGGTISKPEIDIKPAIYKGVGGILKKIFPPTLVASFLLSGANGDISFKPIEFSPGSKKMDSEAKTYADNILELLNEHPKLSLDFCGRSTYEDLASKADLPSKSQVNKDMEEGDDSENNQESLIIETEILEKYDPEMIELAVDRTGAVRSYLIEEKGADPGRIAECRPYFDVNDPGSPRVEISF
jgi:hypothetical protein